MSTLAPVQPVGINTDFIANCPLLLLVQEGFMGGSVTITLEDDTPFINIERELLSAKHRIHFTDARSDHKLFEMTKESFSSTYHAEHPDDSERKLFSVQFERAFVGGPTAYVNFANVANGDNETRFEYKIHTFGSINMVTWDGQPVAEIERGGRRKDYSIQVAPNVDPLPIVAMLLALIDRARKKKDGRSTMGNPSNGIYAVNMGTAAWQGATLGAAM